MLQMVAIRKWPAAWLEPTADQDETASALALELHRLAGWLGLDTIAAPVKGDFAGPLGAALAGVP